MSSKRHLRARKCGTKRRYPDQHAAISAAVGIAGGNSNRMTAYRCRWCGWYHIGHLRPTTRKNKRW